MRNHPEHHFQGWGDDLCMTSGNGMNSAHKLKVRRWIHACSSVGVHAHMCMHIRECLCAGFGVCGVPENLINALSEREEVKDLTVITSNAGLDDFGAGVLARSKQVRLLLTQQWDLIDLGRLSLCSRLFVLFLGCLYQNRKKTTTDTCESIHFKGRHETWQWKPSQLYNWDIPVYRLNLI